MIQNRIERAGKMKRLIFLVVIIVLFGAVCLSQSRSRSLPLRIVELPDPKLSGPLSIEEVLAKPVTMPQFTTEQVKFLQIGQLAWAGQGIIDKQSGLRTVPSVEGTHPVKLYFAIEKGLFVYVPQSHSLEEVFDDDIRDTLGQATLQPQTVAQAACDVIVVGELKKFPPKYRNKARKYLFLETGRIAQNIQLQTAALELVSVSVENFDTKKVRKACKLPTTLEPICIVSVGFPRELSGQERKVREAASNKTRKAVLVVARENFRDEELFDTKRQLNQAGIETTMASMKIGVLRGMLGGRVQSTILIKDILVDNYDAIIFIGGTGAMEYFRNPVVFSIIREAAYKRKVLGAISISPMILANAGVLEGVRATVSQSESIILRRLGAIYTGADVERDGLIITANSPKAATRFGQAIANTLLGK